MNIVLSALLILALAIAIIFDYIRIVQYINMRKVAKEFDERAETTLDEIINILTAMVKDKKSYESLMLDRTKDIQKTMLNLASGQLRLHKSIEDKEGNIRSILFNIERQLRKEQRQLRNIQEIIHKTEKRK